MTKVIVCLLAVFYSANLEAKRQRMAVTDPNTLLGDIVRLCPASLELFARHNLDLCCEAGDSLEAVARRHNLDLGRLLGEIDEAMGTG